MKFPTKCIINTNVPINANLVEGPDSIPEDLVDCVNMCVEAIAYMIEKGNLVIDSNWEIFNEYSKHLSENRKNGIGNKFVKWIYNNIGNKSM